MKIIINQRKIASRMYLKLGWAIVPVGRDKKPLIQWKPFQYRLPTIQETDNWLEEWPNLNWAVVTGSISGIIVLDIDPRNGGDESMKLLVKQYGFLPATAKVKTGGGGRHYYFKHPGFPVKNITLKPGVEIKGDGALITLPPSIHKSGYVYEWVRWPNE